MRGKLGGLLIKPSLKGMMKTFDATEYGGAPLLGLRGLVVKTHGNAKALNFKTSILQCVEFKERDLGGIIKNRLGVD